MYVLFSPHTGGLVPVGFVVRRINKAGATHVIPVCVCVCVFHYFERAVTLISVCLVCTYKYIKYCLCLLCNVCGNSLQCEIQLAASVI